MYEDDEDNNRLWKKHGELFFFVCMCQSRLRFVGLMIVQYSLPWLTGTCAQVGAVGGGLHHQRRSRSMHPPFASVACTTRFFFLLFLFLVIFFFSSSVYSAELSFFILFLQSPVISSVPHRLAINIESYGLELHWDNAVVCTGPSVITGQTVYTQIQLISVLN